MTKGLLKTKPLARLSKLILYFFDNFIYFSIDVSPLLVKCLENLPGHKEYLEFNGLLFLRYLPVNLPPAKGEYANKLHFFLITTSELAISKTLLIKLYPFCTDCILGKSCISERLMYSEMPHGVSFETPIYLIFPVLISL